MIGTGASAAQFIPIVAEEADELIVFQRTPNWLAPTPDYHECVADGQRWLYTHVPSYSQWHRFLMFWRLGDGVIPTVTVDPAWQPHDQAVSELNDLAHAPDRVPGARVRGAARPAGEGGPQLSGGRQADPPTTASGPAR